MSSSASISYRRIIKIVALITLAALFCCGGYVFLKIFIDQSPDDKKLSVLFQARHPGFKVINIENHGDPDQRWFIIAYQGSTNSGVKYAHWSFMNSTGEFVERTLDCQSSAKE